MTLETYPACAISTAHVTPETLEWLAIVQHYKGSTQIMIREYGAFLKMPIGILLEDMPKDLATVIKSLYIGRGFHLIELDCHASEVDFLPTYEHA